MQDSTQTPTTASAVARTWAPEGAVAYALPWTDPNGVVDTPWWIYDEGEAAAQRDRGRPVVDVDEILGAQITIPGGDARDLVIAEMQAQHDNLHRRMVGITDHLAAAGAALGGRVAPGGRDGDRLAAVRGWLDGRRRSYRLYGQDTGEEVTTLLEAILDSDGGRP